MTLVVAAMTHNGGQRIVTIYVYIYIDIFRYLYSILGRTWIIPLPHSPILPPFLVWFLLGNVCMSARWHLPHSMPNPQVGTDTNTHTHSRTDPQPQIYTRTHTHTHTHRCMKTRAHTLAHTHWGRFWFLFVAANNRCAAHIQRHLLSSTITESLMRCFSSSPADCNQQMRSFINPLPENNLLPFKWVHSFLNQWAAAERLVRSRLVKQHCCCTHNYDVSSVVYMLSSYSTYHGTVMNHAYHTDSKVLNVLY